MTNADTIVFLDLEQTIIASWDDPYLCNVSKIRDFLEKLKVKEIGIFSFAIYNDTDVAIFWRDIAPIIERALDVKVLVAPSVQSQIRIDREFTGHSFSPDTEVHDFIALRGKVQAFINYVNATYHYNRAILIDDVVPDHTLTDRRNGWSIEFYNVDRI